MKMKSRKPEPPQWLQLLQALRKSPTRSLHTFEIRQQLRIGNPSERIRDLESRGYLIDHKREKRNGRWGVRYIYVGHQSLGRPERRPVGGISREDTHTSPPSLENDVADQAPTLEVWDYTGDEPRTYRRPATPAECRAFFERDKVAA